MLNDSNDQGIINALEADQLVQLDFQGYGAFFLPSINRDTMTMFVVGYWVSFDS